jgi:Na+-transporting methylmalonyl-CoA/oxaloacetate decarboxylase gamma subunit
MILEVFLFLLFLVPSVIGWLKKRFFTKRTRSAISDVKKQENEKRFIKSSLRMIVSAIPYFGAFIFADLPYLWLTLGLVYLVIGILTLLMFSMAFGYKTKHPEEHEKPLLSR